MIRINILTCLLLATAPAYAADCEGEPCDDTGPLWLSLIHAKDAARLEAAHTTNQAALQEGQRRASTNEDKEILTNVASWLTAKPQTLVFAELEGKWKCRTIKVGGILPVIRYRNFRCEMGIEERVMWFKKTSGSQRSAGLIYQEDDVRGFYLGKAHYSGETPASYASGSDDRDDVAEMKVLDDNHVILIFPAPYRESKMNILELTR